MLLHSASLKIMASAVLFEILRRSQRPQLDVLCDRLEVSLATGAIPLPGKINAWAGLRPKTANFNQG